MFLLLQNLCISLQKGQKRVLLRGCFCIEMPHRTHKSHRNQVGFCVFGVWLYVILNEIHAEGSGCQQPTAVGFRLLVEVFRCLREAFESIFSKLPSASRFAFLRFCKRKRKRGIRVHLIKSINELFIDYYIYNRHALMFPQKRKNAKKVYSARARQPAPPHKKHTPWHGRKIFLAMQKTGR